jgi:hypothetical protein
MNTLAHRFQKLPMTLKPSRLFATSVILNIEG